MVIDLAPAKRLQQTSCMDQRAGPKPPFRLATGNGVIRDDPWFQFPRGAEQIYKTDLLFVKMIDPLFDQLSLRADIIHAVGFAAQARANFVGA